MQMINDQFEMMTTLFPTVRAERQHLYSFWFGPIFQFDARFIAVSTELFRPTQQKKIVLKYRKIHFKNTRKEIDWLFTTNQTFLHETNFLHISRSIKFVGY